MELILQCSQAQTGYNFIHSTTQNQQRNLVCFSFTSSTDENKAKLVTRSQYTIHKQLKHPTTLSNCHFKYNPA